ncbi:MAG: ABC transporter permease [Lachnospiraceae bacterium]|nr:ABC transporter permease [Lachnospiraceae bacterium]
MKLTAELALSQVKINSRRSLGAILATSLSTALVTGVMCFVTSGNAMLVNFLGEDYGDYGGAYKTILLIPALILGLLIAFMSVTVISNIYESSAGKRIGEFGTLKCVGATKAQIRETVVFEGLWIGLVGIPLGLIFGTLLGFIGVKIAGRYIDSFVELSKSIVMRPMEVSLPFSVSVWTYVFAAFFALIVVIVSAGKPAKRACKIKAIHCIKGLEGVKPVRKGRDVSDFAEKILGYEGGLGYKNIKRKASAYKSTIRALALSITLILILGSLSKQAAGIMDWMGVSMGNDMLVSLTSAMDEGVNPITGKEEIKILVPFSNEVEDELTDRLREFGIPILAVGENRCTYNTVYDEGIVTNELKAVPGVVDEFGELETTLTIVDSDYYAELCERAGVPVGSNILVNAYSYNDEGSMKDIVPFRDDVTYIELADSADNRVKLKIDGMLYTEDLPENAFRSLAGDPVRVIVPEGDARYITWYCDPADDEKFSVFARSVLDEKYPLLTEDTYYDLGYNVQISRADQMIKVMNIAIILGEIILTGLIILILLMGFASVISTLSSNIRIRRREFAVLKSVGMTRAALEKMLYGESLCCISKAVVKGTAFGILIPWAINFFIRKVFAVRYELPVMYLVLGIVVVALTVVAITKIELSKLSKQNIIEDIRMD